MPPIYKLFPEKATGKRRNLACIWGYMLISKKSARFARYLANCWLGRSGTYYWHQDRKVRKYLKEDQVIQWSEQRSGDQVDVRVEHFSTHEAFSYPDQLRPLLGVGVEEQVPAPQAEPACQASDVPGVEATTVKTLTLREKLELCATQRLAIEFGMPAGATLSEIVTQHGTKAVLRFQELIRKVPAYGLSERRLQFAFPAEYAAIERGS